MPIWATVLVAVCGGTGAFNLIAIILQHRWNVKKSSDDRIDAIMAAQRVSMEERIRYLVQYYAEKGKISLAEKSNLREYHRCYVGVGGNGNLDTEMAELEKIPVKG